jgi:hypothetical protein
MAEEQNINIDGGLEVSIQELETDGPHGERANIVDGLYAIAGAISDLAHAIHRLGTNDAATPMGAIEVLSVEIKEGTSRVADAIGEVASMLADAIRDIPT